MDRRTVIHCVRFRTCLLNCMCCAAISFLFIAFLQSSKGKYCYIIIVYWLFTVDFVKLVRSVILGVQKENTKRHNKSDSRRHILIAKSLNVANGQQETDSSSFQLPPVERNEEILFSNIDFDEPMYCTSRPQSREDLQHAVCSSNDITSVEAQDTFRCRSDSEWESSGEWTHFYAEIAAMLLVRDCWGSDSGCSM